jgi:hypothetical protein
LRRECFKPQIGTPIALEKHGGLIDLVFGFENDKMLTATINGTATEEKWILPAAANKPPKGRFCL